LRTFFYSQFNQMRIDWKEPYGKRSVVRYYPVETYKVKLEDYQQITKNCTPNVKFYDYHLFKFPWPKDNREVEELVKICELVMQWGELNEEEKKGYLLMIIVKYYNPTYMVEQRFSENVNAAIDKILEYEQQIREESNVIADDVPDELSVLEEDIVAVQVRATEIIQKIEEDSSKEKLLSVIRWTAVEFSIVNGIYWRGHTDWMLDWPYIRGDYSNYLITDILRDYNMYEYDVRVDLLMCKMDMQSLRLMSMVNKFAYNVFSSKVKMKVNDWLRTRSESVSGYTAVPEMLRGGCFRCEREICDCIDNGYLASRMVRLWGDVNGDLKQFFRLEARYGVAIIAMMLYEKRHYCGLKWNMSDIRYLKIFASQRAQDYLTLMTPFMKYRFKKYVVTYSKKIKWRYKIRDYAIFNQYRRDIVEGDDVMRIV